MEVSIDKFIDELICSTYASRRMSGRARLIESSENDFLKFIDKYVRHSPIENSEDIFLLRVFDRMRREFASMPIPVYSEPPPVSGEINCKTSTKEIENETCKIDNKAV